MKITVNIQDGEYWWGGFSSEIDGLPIHAHIGGETFTVSASIDVLPYFVKKT